MGYYMKISEHDLKYERDISDKMDEFLEKNEFYLLWNHGDGHMDLDDGCFKWSSEFVKDLLVLKEMGVRGHITCYDEDGEYLKYEIHDKGVKEYIGSVVFPEDPEIIIKSMDDILCISINRAKNTRKYLEWELIIEL